VCVAAPLRYFGGKDKLKFISHMLRKKPLQLSRSGRKLSKALPGPVVDATIHATVCKHIHLIHMRSPNSLTKVTINQVSLNSKTNSEIVKYFIDTALPQLPESKHNVQQKLYQLQTLVVDCTDSDALNAAAKHLQNAITAMKALQRMLK